MNIPNTLSLQRYIMSSSRMASRLIRWYLADHRPLPWRETRNPYHIWLSEVILQQTRVDQGLSYYLEFTGAFPTVADLAKAPEDLVLKYWQGLGYYSRARNLHAAAKRVVEEHKGIFPSQYELIRTLPGIGPYTAAAVASIAFDLPYAAVDGNVYRFLSRLFGIETPIDSPEGKKQFQELAGSLLDRKRPGLFNQAMMEFGAMVCRPANPACAGCLFADECVAFRSGRVKLLPVKGKKQAVRDRYLYYIIYIDRQGNTLVGKRTGKDIWEGLYEFPLIETNSPSDTALPEITGRIAALSGSNAVIRQVSPEIRHQLSHQLLHAVFIHVSVPRLPAVNWPGYFVCPAGELEQYAFPRLISRYLENGESMSFT